MAEQDTISTVKPTPEVNSELQGVEDNTKSNVNVTVNESKLEQKLAPKQAPFKLVSAGKVESKPLINLLIYGDFGVGKTLLSSTAQDVPEMRDVLYIEADGGDKIINDREDITEVKFVREYSTVARIYEFLSRHCYFRNRNDRENLIKLESMFRDEPVTEPKLFNTVVIDSLTEVQQYCMHQILGIKMEDWRLDAEPVKPVGDDWGTDITMIRGMIRKFKDLPLNTIFICSRKDNQDEVKRVYRTPQLPGQLANLVQGFLDFVGYYISAIGDDKQVHRRIYFTPSRTYQAKNRWRHWNGTYLDDPTMTDIYKLELDEQKLKKGK